MGRWEVIEDRYWPGTWRAERIGEDGECYVTIFSGPFCKTRATAYAIWMNEHGN